MSDRSEHQLREVGFGRDQSWECDCRQGLWRFEGFACATELANAFARHCYDELKSVGELPVDPFGDGAWEITQHHDCSDCKGHPTKEAS